MPIITLLSLILRLTACAWSAVLWRRLRDWRFGFLFGFLAVLFTYEATSELQAPVTAGFGRFAEFGVSLLSLLAVIFIERAITEERRVSRQLETERAYLAQLFESAPEAIVLMDNDGRVLRTNTEFERMFGYVSGDVQGKLLDELIAPEGHAGEANDLTRRVARGERVALETVRLRSDRTPIDVSVLGTPIHARGGQVAVYGIYRDITERRRAERALRESEQRYALAALGANDGLWDWDLLGDTVYYSPRWKAMLGLRDGDIGASPDEWMRRVHPEDAARLKKELALHIEGLAPHFQTEYRILHQDGAYRWMLVRGVAERKDGPRATRLAGSQTDISERKKAEEQLIHDAFHDVLTGLPNRALFTSLLERSIARLRRNATYRFAVLFLDVDRFKVVNDSLGHMVGDQLLISAARRITACVRPGDTVARLGGDEFTILLDDIGGSDDATRVAERIQSELATPFTVQQHEVFTSASIGIALSSDAYRRSEEILRDADTAMYRAKSRGRACHEVFDARMHAHAVTVLKLETDLRRAIDRDELRLFYQPIVMLATGDVIGFEALLRWAHPERGLVAPIEFIRLAEETGLIIPIGQWVLWEACRQAEEWRALQPSSADRRCTVSVNLSARQFGQPTLVESVADALSVTGLPATCLRLEITESILMDHAETSVRLLDELKASGVQVQVDDFGTGYSSLSYLHRFNLDALKIDQSFVSRLGSGGENGEIVRTIVTLARNLDMAVVAEGVESEAQREYLIRLGCDQAQGFLFSGPVEAAEAATLLRGAQPA